MKKQTKPKHDWPSLLKESESFPTIKAFAERKGMNYDQLRVGLSRERNKQASKQNRAKTPQEATNSKNPRGSSKAKQTGAEKGAQRSKEANKAKPSNDTCKVGRLTTKQTKLANGILEGKSHKQAAIEAGYSSSSAGSAASRVLRHSEVQGYIAKTREQLREHIGITAADIAERVAQIGFSSIDEAFNVEGNGDITLENLKEGGRGLALSKIKVKKTTRITKDGEVTTTEYEFTSQDQIKALATLNKMLGYEDPQTYNSARSKDKTVRAIWKHFSEGRLKAQDAYNYFDAYGVPCPQSIVDQAKAEYKIALEEDNGSSVAGLDYDTLEARWVEYQASLKAEREKFLPQREKELQEMRNEHDQKNGQQPDTKQTPKKPKPEGD